MGLVTPALVRHLNDCGLVRPGGRADQDAILADWLQTWTTDPDQAQEESADWLGLAYRHATDLPLSALPLDQAGEWQVWQWADGTCCCTRLPDAPALAAFRRSYPHAALYLTDPLLAAGRVQAAPRPSGPAPEDSLEALLKAPAGHVDRTIGALIYGALKAGATDLHLTPDHQGLMAECRVSGRLVLLARLEARAKEEVINKVKMTCGMDIAEHRLPQDGQMILSAQGKIWQMRAATLPLAAGEKVVIRLLAEEGRTGSLGDLGFSAGQASLLEGLLDRPQGLILLTGPTNSGKTTLLYALLNRLADRRRAIYTIEDPIEAVLPRIQQMQVNIRAGFTFAAGLRGALRCDPDVLAVGELRDDDSAQIAARAALAGHLVLATLHAGDAHQAVGRLREMSLSDGMISAVLAGVVNGRLAPAACSVCGGSGQKEGHCCPACMGTGRGGRLGLHEIWLPSEADRARIEEGLSTRALRRAALGEGFVTLEEDQETKAGLLFREDAP